MHDSEMTPKQMVFDGLRRHRKWCESADLNKDRGQLLASLDRLISWEDALENRANFRRSCRRAKAPVHAAAAD